MELNPRNDHIEISDSALLQRTSMAADFIERVRSNQQKLAAALNLKIQFESVDVMRVQNGKITDHWGVGNLLSLMRQIGGWTPPPEI